MRGGRRDSDRRVDALLREIEETAAEADVDIDEPVLSSEPCERFAEHDAAKSGGAVSTRRPRGVFASSVTSRIA